MLAEHLEKYDATGRWMSFHLAELVSVAEDGEISVPEREAIVELILKVWAQRSAYPGSSPLAQYDHVLAALERLGDDRPWRFARIPIGQPEDGEKRSAADALVGVAVDLESLVRESVIRLLWLAAHDARRTAGVWLDAIDGVAESIEQDTDSLLGRLRRRLELAEADGTPGEQLDDVELAAAFSNEKHATRLREMAALLTAAADGLGPTPLDPA